MPVPIFIDLDETLIHARKLLGVIQDSAFVYGGHTSKDNLDPDEIRTCRQALDALVSQEAQERNALDVGQQQRELRKREAIVARRLLDRQGWRNLKLEDGPELIVKARPGAARCLGTLANLGPLHLCTNATRVYAEACLEIFGLGHHFEGLYCREEVFESDTGLDLAPFLLIDDLPPEAGHVQRKLLFIAESEVPAVGESSAPRLERFLPYHLEVQTWTGEAGDLELERTVDLVIERLARIAQ